MFKKDKTLRKDMMQQWKASLPPPLFAPAPSPGMELPHPGVPRERAGAIHAQEQARFGSGIQA